MSKEKETSSEVNVDITKFLLPGAIVVAGIFIAIALMGGNKSNDTTVSQDKQVTGDTDTETPPPTAETGANGFKQTSVSIDDDPILGNRDSAQIAIVEFSDYECPFCKRHFEQTFSQVKAEYVDTGKAIIVYRDYPLSFHDPLATQQAMAGECVQDLGGDGKYYEYHDLLYETTSSNGQGMQKTKLYDLAEQVGIDRGSFTDCLDSEKFKQEVQSDFSDGGKAGVTGTPGFVIGKLDTEGNVEGYLIAGAYPFSEFKTIIDELLSN